MRDKFENLIMVIVGIIITGFIGAVVWIAVHFIRKLW